MVAGAAFVAGTVTTVGFQVVSWFVSAVAAVVFAWVAPRDVVATED